MELISKIGQTSIGLIEKLMDIRAELVVINPNVTEGGTDHEGPNVA